MLTPPARESSVLSKGMTVLVLVVAAVAPYLGTLAFGYVMDDTTAIRSNPDINGWGSLLRVWLHPYGGPDSPYFGLYRPVTMTLFALVWNAGRHWPLWFHFAAIVLHVIATLLVWRTLGRVTAPIVALVAAGLFAVHPVHVEAVANVANSSEILVAIWTCALVLQVARAAERSGSIPWAPASIGGLLYLAAFLSKESGAVAPVLALLWVWGEGRVLGSGTTNALSAIAARWWRVIAAWSVAAAIVVTARAIVLGGPVTGEPIAAAGLSDLTPAQRVWAMLSLGPRILRLLIWPSGLNPHYGPTTFDRPAQTWLVTLTLLTLAVCSVVGLALARRGERRFVVGTAWIAVALLPAANLLVATGQILAERTLYVPSIGVVLLLATVLDAFRDRFALGRRPRDIVAAAVTGVALVTVGMRTARWTNVWSNHTTLFARMIEADPMGYRGYWLSGLAARGRGDVGEALALFRRAYELYPRDFGLLIDYSQTLVGAGDHARAANVAANLMSSPRHRQRSYTVALYLDALGSAYGPDSVIAAGQRLMKDSPSATAALFVGRAYELRGNKDAAIAAYREGLRFAPRDSLLQFRLRVLRVAR